MTTETATFLLRFLSLQGLPARPSLAHADPGRRRIPAAADAPRPAAWLPQAAALRLPGQPGAAGETRAVPHPLGARHPPPGLCRGHRPKTPEVSTGEPGAV